MSNLSLSMALDHYERHIPWIEGTAGMKCIDLNLLIIGQEGIGGRRHERMLANQEFDICELSLGSYVMAKARGVSLTAIPIFPRRLFSQSQMYINTQLGIKEPKDLIGKKVALRSFQTTLSVLAKGDLATEYGVPLDQVHWVTTADEPVDFEPPANVTVERMERGKTLGEELVQGEVSAYLSPRPPKPYLEQAQEVGRLFSDPRKEEINYYKRNGFYPIMHIIALKTEVLDRHPWIALSAMEGFQNAQKIWSGYMDDPNWSRLTWGRHYLEEERNVFGGDPWAIGVEANRPNLERFISYEYEQGLIPNKMSVDDLFFETTLKS